MFLHRDGNVFISKKNIFPIFLHLGGNVVIPKKDIITIIDIRTKVAPSTKEFLEIANDEGFIESISDEGKEKSFIITDKEIYISPISCTTLNKRTLSYK